MNCPECETKMTVDITGKLWYCKKCDNEFEQIDGEWIVVS